MTYRGLGVYQRPKRRWPIAVAIVAAVVVIAAAVVIVTTRWSPAAAPVPAPTTAPTTEASPAVETSVENEAARVRYAVPEGWRPTEDARVGLPGMALTGVAVRGEYRCGGKDYTRGLVGGGTAPPGEVNQVASDLARGFGRELYGSGQGLQVTVGTPKRSGGAVRVDAAVTTSGDECLARRGRVTVVVLDHAGALRVVVVNGDLEGGPQTPPPPTEAELRAIADSVRPTG